MKMKIKVKEIAYHRNGVSGNGFYVVRFVHDNAPFLGIVFDDPSSVAVFNMDLLKDDVIAFRENSWRGDWFEDELREAIHEYVEKL